MQPKHVVLSNPKPGLEDEFNQWYDRVHVPDVLTRLQGFTGVRRFRLVERAEMSVPRWRYLAVWDIDAMRLAEAIASVRSLAADHAAGRFDPDDTLHRANPGIAEYSRSWFQPVDRRGLESITNCELLMTAFAEQPIPLANLAWAERYSLASAELEPEFGHLLLASAAIDRSDAHTMWWWSPV